MTNSSKITISLDCLGGDNYPKAIIDGMVIFLKKNKNKDIKFLLFGDSDLIEKELKRYKNFSNYYEIVHTTKKILSEDKPSTALRKGRDSSMGLAIESVKNKNSDACISAGNTGALMALSKLILRPMNDVDRPALIQMMPAKDGNSVAMLDMGANIDCSSENLYQFALMGSIFYSSITGNSKPRIGLLNIGSEDLKGNDVIKHTAIMLKESFLKENFYGFIEGNDIFRNVVDVIVTDGFTGNVALKTIEGTAKFIALNLKQSIKNSILAKLGCLFMFTALKKFKQKINPENYNGAMFVGLNGISVKAHGNSNGIAFYYAIENTIRLVKSDINKKIVDLLTNVDFDN